MSVGTPVLLIERTLREVVRLLVQKDYAYLERLTNAVRLKASEIEAGIAEYGRTIITPPLEAFSNIDVIPIRSSVPPAYSIRFRLYTQEEGRSDLELQATFVEEPVATQMKVEIDNIIVA
jgi:hypothetical protein